MSDVPVAGVAVEGSGVLVRKASGLVREVSAFDAMAGNVVAFNPVIAAVTLMAVPWTFPGASLWLAALLSLVPAALLATVYGLYTIAMPRSGGDYMFISRTLNPAIGFAANFSFAAWLAIWTGVSANWISTVGLSGLFGALGLVGHASFWSGAATTVSGKWVAVGIGTFFNVTMAALVVLGLRRAFKMIKLMFAASLVGLITTIVVVAATSHHTFISKWNAHGSYSGIIKAAHKSGYSSPTSWTESRATILSVGLLILSTVFVVLSSYIGGETRRVTKSVPIGMFGSLAIGGLFLLLMAVVAVHTWGNEFIAAVNTVFNLDPNSYTAASAPNYNFLAGVGNPNALLIVLVSLPFIFVPLASLVWNDLIVSRCIFAWSADRILPEKAAEVDRRFHSPVIAVVAAAIAGEAALFWYTFYANATKFLAGTTMGFIATFATTAIAAVVFPYLPRSRWLYEASPLRPKLLGIPVISLAGVFTCAVFGVAIYGFMTNDLFGANTTTGLLFFGALWIAGLVIFGLVWMLRRIQGVPMDVAFAELPPE